MEVTTVLDVDVLAVEDEDSVSVLLELAAPEPPPSAQRAATSLQVVLDRSGSMAGGRLEGAKSALLEVVDRLDPRDTFGLVAFDDQALVVVPAGTLTDKTAVKRAISGIDAGGSTDLMAGYLRGLHEVRRAGGRGTVLLISDGHANQGVTSPEVLGGVAETAHREHGVVTATLGYGLGYDEVLLSAISKGGNGSEHFAENPDDAAVLIASEVDELLSQTAQAMSLLVRMSPHVRSVVIHNDLPVHEVAEGLQVELGGMYAGQTRRLVLTFDVQGVLSLGLAELATMVISYVELPDLRPVEVTVPIRVGIVPGDEAAGRVRNPQVRAEVAYQRAQQAKREASRRLSEGDLRGASVAFSAAMSGLSGAMACAPVAMTALFDDELTVLAELKDLSASDVSHAAKRSSADAARKSRRR